MEVQIRGYMEQYVQFITTPPPSIRLAIEAGYNVFDSEGNEIKGEVITYPCLNMQIDGFPKKIDDHYYGQYFEIPFETGCLFVIHRQTKFGPIEVEIFKDFLSAPEESVKTLLSNWNGVKNLLWAAREGIDVGSLISA